MNLSPLLRHHDRTPPPRNRAMTLIELLAVVAIMAVMIGLTVGAFQSFSRGVDVTNSIQGINDAMNLARQIAVSGNEYAQVRFFSPEDSSDPRDGQYMAVGIYRSESPYYTNNYSALMNSGRFRQEGQITTLPQSCIAINNATLSPLLAALAADTTALRTGKTRFPNGKDYNWVGFYFKPDGSTDLPASSSNHVVSVSAAQAYKAANSLPPNYAILSLNRVSGRWQIVRP